MQSSPIQIAPSGGRKTRIMKNGHILKFIVHIGVDVSLNENKSGTFSNRLPNLERN